MKKLKENFPNRDGYKVKEREFSIFLQYKNREVDILIGVEASSPEEVASKTLNGHMIYHASNGKFQDKLFKEFSAKYGQLRNRILLAKYWLKLQTIKEKLNYEDKPISYGIELLVYHHCSLQSNKKMDQVTWLRSFLSWFGSGKITNPIKFKKSNYNPKPAPSGISIVDPGNPSRNVVGKWKNRKKLQTLARSDSKLNVKQIFEGQ